MNLMRFGAEYNDNEAWTDDAELVIENVEQEKSTEITTVYCTRGYYFTLTKEDLEKINKPLAFD